MSRLPKPTVWRYLGFILTLPYWILRAAARSYWDAQLEELEEKKP